jgi:hypothetical protein
MRLKSSDSNVIRLPRLNGRLADVIRLHRAGSSDGGDPLPAGRGRHPAPAPHYGTPSTENAVARDQGFPPKKPAPDVTRPGAVRAAPPQPSPSLPKGLRVAARRRRPRSPGHAGAWVAAAIVTFLCWGGAVGLSALLYPDLWAGVTAADIWQAVWP